VSVGYRIFFALLGAIFIFTSCGPKCHCRTAGPVESPGSIKTSPAAEKGKAEDAAPVRLTDKSAAALKKLTDQGHGPWVIFAQGLCNGNPAVGIYETNANPPRGGESITVKGINFIIEEDVVELQDKHGDLYLDGPVDKDNNFTVSFKFSD